MNKILRAKRSAKVPKLEKILLDICLKFYVFTP